MGNIDIYLQMMLKDPGMFYVTGIIATGDDGKGRHETLLTDAKKNPGEYGNSNTSVTDSQRIYNTNGKKDPDGVGQQPLLSIGIVCTPEQLANLRKAVSDEIQRRYDETVAASRAATPGADSGGNVANHSAFY